MFKVKIHRYISSYLVVVIIIVGSIAVGCTNSTTQMLNILSVSLFGFCDSNNLCDIPLVDRSRLFVKNCFHKRLTLQHLLSNIYSIVKDSNADLTVEK